MTTPATPTIRRTLLELGVGVGMFVVMDLARRGETDALGRICEDAEFADKVCRVLSRQVMVDVTSEDGITERDVELMTESVLMLADRAGAS